MQGIMLKMLFTELMRTVYDDYKVSHIGELYQITDEVDQSVAAIQVLANADHCESLGIED